MAKIKPYSFSKLIDPRYGEIKYYIINDADEIVESFTSKENAKTHCSYLKKLTGMNSYWVISVEEYEEMLSLKKG